MKFGGSQIINILIILALVFGGAIIYFKFFGSDDTPGAAQTPEASDSNPESVPITVSRLNTLMSRLQRVTLDTSIITRADFSSLVDFSIPISAEPRGTTNPFGPPPF